MLASIGQAIMHAIRPRVLLAPLQLGLQMHRQFSSRNASNALIRWLRNIKEVRQLLKGAFSILQIISTLLMDQVLSTDGHIATQSQG